jgi:hypothetical protein
MTRPVFEKFDHHIDFAMALFRFLNQTKFLSYRRANELAGFSSPNFLHLILHKKRFIGCAESANNIARALEMDEKETAYFYNEALRSFDHRNMFTWNSKELKRNRKTPERVYKIPKNIRSAVMVLGEEEVDESCPGHPDFKGY